MIDFDTKNRIEDYFEGHELVEFLQIPIEMIVHYFENEIEDSLDDIEEFIGVRRRNEG